MKRPAWLILGLLAGCLVAWFDSSGWRDDVMPIDDWLWYTTFGVLVGLAVDGYRYCRRTG